MAEVSSHRALFHLRKGGLHNWARNQGWEGKDSDPLPEEYKHKAAASDIPHVQKMGQFSLNAEHFKGQK